jgi:acyl carrier protein
MRSKTTTPPYSHGVTGSRDTDLGFETVSVTCDKKHHAEDDRMTQVTHEQVLRRITELVRELSEDDTVVLRDDSTAQDVEWWDSLLHVRLFLALESEYKIRFETREVTKPSSVGEMIALIRQKLNHG